jgi:hypothetical protein
MAAKIVIFLLPGGTFRTENHITICISSTIPCRKPDRLYASAAMMRAALLSRRFGVWVFVPPHFETA